MPDVLVEARSRQMEPLEKMTSRTTTREVASAILKKWRRGKSSGVGQFEKRTSRKTTTATASAIVKSEKDDGHPQVMKG